MKNSLEINQSIVKNTELIIVTESLHNIVQHNLRSSPNKVIFFKMKRILNIFYPNTNEKSQEGGNKKFRKHQGIYQSGPKAGNLKPNYKYSGKKTKTSLKIIIKIK